MRERQTKKGLNALYLTLGLFGVTLGLMLVAIILQHRGTSSLFANNIVVITLFNVNLIILVVLFLLLSRNLIKFYFERRQDQPGARFQTKLILAFVGFSLIPTVLLAVVASGLLNRSIDSWFNVQVENSLGRSLDVAQMYYQKNREHSLILARDLGRTLSDKGKEERTASLFSPSRVQQVVRPKIQAFQVSGLEVFNPEGDRVFRYLRSGLSAKSFPWIGQTALAQKAPNLPFTMIRPAQKGDVILAVAPITVSGNAKDPGRVVIYQVISPELVSKMQEITLAFEEYHQLSALKNPIKRTYILSFLAITLLILFSATWFGYYLAKGITIPIQKLAEATRAVADGNLDDKLDIRARDEIGVLVDAFNKMTGDLKHGNLKIEEANQSLRISNQELAREKNTMETVLENITTGVIFLDEGGHIITLNRSAENILGISKETMIGKSFHELFHHVPVEVGKQLVKKIREGQGSLTQEELQFELQNRFVTLRLNMASLYGEGNRYLGMVIAFDDISELVKAQRTAAWQEVAQRLAHEIKNPLTPIQLSAQRLRKKHYEQAPDYDKIFDECTQTIIQEVHSLKVLLHEFSTFARMPAAHPAPASLHEIIGEVVRLYRGAHRDIEILENLDPNVPQMSADREQLKRMFINLFENATEAMDQRGKIWIETFYNSTNQKIRITIADEGAGISPEDKSRLFIPYFSRKKSGTGLGLAIVQRIISEHDGVIRVEDHLPKGSRFVIELPVAAPSR